MPRRSLDGAELKQKVDEQPFNLIVEFGPLVDRGSIHARGAEEDVGRVVEHWGFPLAGLDLSELPVSAEELERERQAVVADFY